MEVAITIGPENSPTSVVVAITCEGDDAYPDFLDDACRRAGTEALRVHQTLAGDEA